MAGDMLDVLIVGEGTVPMSVIEAELRRSGLDFTLTHIACEAEMLAACRVPPDVVVAMDSDDTFDAVATLALCRELCVDAPLIVIANALNEELIVEALRSGVTDYVVADRLSRLGPALARAVRERADAVARLAAEEASRLAEARFRGVFENAPVGMCIRIGSSVLANREYLRLYGYATPAQVPGDLMAQIAPEYREISASLMAGGPAAGVFEGVALRMDGTRFPFEMRVTAMRLGDEAATVTFVSDITDRKAAEAELDGYRKDLERMVKERTEELMAANRRLQEATETRIRFLSSMSHELRTPLNSVIGFAGVLLQGLSGPLTEEQQRQLDIIYGAGRRLMDTIEDVLDVSRIEAGKAQPDWEQFELDTVLRGWADGVRAMLEERGLDFVVEIPEGHVEMVSDRRMVTQIMRGLMDNAVKFTQHGSIALSLTRADGDVLVSVRDTGPGIPPDELPHIFEEFRQVRLADGTRPEGAGLGLSICSKLALLLGGSLTAKSVPGQGSEFVLTLPVGPVIELGSEPS